MLLALLLAGAAPIVGSWGLPDGTVFAEFRADGTCWSRTDGPCTYTLAGDALTVTYATYSTSLTATIAGDALTLDGGMLPITFVRVGGKGGKAGKAPSAPVNTTPPLTIAPPAALPTMDLRDPLAVLLLSSAWCTFSYNQTTGASSSTRTQFAKDGTFFVGARSEGYSSGAGGTMASQHDARATGRWLVNKGRLWLALPQENPALPQNALTQVAFTVKRNSNGAPIIVGGDGTEYAQCP